MALDDIVNAGVNLVRNQKTFEGFNTLLASGVKLDTLPIFLKEMASNQNLYQDLIKQDEDRLYNSVSENLSDVFKQTPEEEIIGVGFEFSEEYKTAVEIQKKLTEKNYEGVKEAYASIFEPELIKRIIKHPDFSEDSLKMLAGGYVSRMQMKFAQNTFYSEEGKGKSKEFKFDFGKAVKYFDKLSDDAKREAYLTFGNNYTARLIEAARNAENSKKE